MTETTIRVSSKTKKALEAFKDYHRESMDFTIRKLLKLSGQIDDSYLTPEEQKLLHKRMKDVDANNILTSAQLRKELFS